ncbi:MAG: amino acid carrier protein [Salibacteraceae bacterium]|jgi:alanine or glycine:cation symporter, AGCS family|nr:amino acid carrier protein [Salibacteraceae bacterium]MDP4687161.1 amino acid carrier protein [Salibacteraceae bacterium]MDP4763808.1 amino acid carrier protein [Salibacteraceae bacterium]MDP4845262.1 amino acid carrier protein [Salibacteraceae bacterium]MDP4964337.1 amino acid carrier protein [Salibacteraceae bacterium]
MRFYKQISSFIILSILISSIAIGQDQMEESQKEKTISEKINEKFQPVVDALGMVLFWDPFEAVGVYDPVVYAEKAIVRAPGWEDQTVSKITVSNWLVANGDEVKKGDVIGEVETNNGLVKVLSPDDGKISLLNKAGDKVFDPTDADLAVDVRSHFIAEVVYDQKRAVLDAKGNPLKKNIPIVVVWLVIGAVFFTIRMKFINLRGFKHAIQLVSGKYSNPNDAGEVSHFQALATALSATVGLGNIAGVAVAISLGGPGATFWMILAGLLGMSSKFVECTLGVKYRHIDEEGNVYGGPMYYLSKGLELKGKKGLGKVLAIIFAILCIGGSFGGGNMFQANQAFAQLASEFTFMADYGALFGVVLSVFVGIVIIGGIKSIAKVTDKIVPIMVGLYVTFAVIIIFSNIGNIGIAFTQIFEGAFMPSAMKGGLIGVLIVGFQRAAFSNEAGVGSASIAHSASKTNEPISEGIVALLEPFIDTVVVCTMTALVLIFTGFADGSSDLTGAELTSAAFSTVFPWFKYVLIIAILLFAFSTMISWSYYGLKSWTYLFGISKGSEIAYKVLFLLFIVIGSASSLGAVLDFSDMMILGMAFPNILGLYFLSGEVRKDLLKYFDDLKTGVIKAYK